MIVNVGLLFPESPITGSTPSSATKNGGASIAERPGVLTDNNVVVARAHRRHLAVDAAMRDIDILGERIICEGVNRSHHMHQ